MTPIAYLAIGCGLLVAYFAWLAVMIRRAPLAHQDDERGLVLGDVPHLPVGLRNINHIHNGRNTPDQEAK